MLGELVGDEGFCDAVFGFFWCRFCVVESRVVCCDEELVCFFWWRSGV